MSGQWKPRKRARVAGAGRGAALLNVLEQIANVGLRGTQRSSQGSSSTRVSGAGRGGSQTATGTSRSTAKATSRRRGGSGTVTRRRRYSKVAGNMSDYSKFSTNYGRKPGFVKKQLRMVKSNTEDTTYVFRNLNQVWGPVGKTNLTSFQAGALGTLIEAPLHIYDLTAINQVSGLAQADVQQAVGHRLTYTNETTSSSAGWTALQDNNNQTFWKVLTSPNQAPQRAEGGSSYLDWVSVKLLLYAATAQPTKVDIMICQFRRDTLCPSPDDGVTQEHTAFWQSMTHRAMYNPILPVNANYKKYFKVLKTVQVEMDPKETTEASGARYKEVNMFLRMNRELDYRWKESALGAILTTGVTTQLNTENMTRVHPRKRVFLMIRSYSPVGLNLATSTAANTVSYDIALTKKHSNMAANM